MASRNVEETRLKQKLYRPPHAHNFTDEEKKRLQMMTKDGSPSPPKPKPRREDTTRPSTFDQVYQDILDRRKWQLQMEDKGAGDATRDATAWAIKERQEELKRLDPQRALAVVRNGFGRTKNEVSFLFNNASAKESVAGVKWT